MIAVCAADEPRSLDSPLECTFIADYDGSQQKYLQLLPRGIALDQPLSVMIALHGHGSDRWQFATQSRDECRAARDVAAAHSMVFISPDYRAKTSWMGPAAEADVVQIIGLLKKQFLLKRLILCGGSMGGTAALTFTARHPQLVDGVVSLNGTANLQEFDGFQEAIAESFGGSKAQVPDQYRMRSAEFFPGQFPMPLAATTGGKDDVVPPESVLRLLKSVARVNPNVLSIHRPSEGHSTNYEDTRQALEFVISHLK
ncbi:MAG: alpha/beta fold hydrolase [Pirellulaceae bacterium]|jgi:pimeloyl-ACP methyl ester carboxylesterase|nr:alpha/beta fold hydrolase [Pirellulaceae bacterium]